MLLAELLDFVKGHRVAVQASVSPSGSAQAAVVGIAVTENLEIVFDCLATSRKFENLQRNPKIALVIGGLNPGDERTVQYEGLADEPRGADLARIKAAYFETYPDGRERETWAGLTYVRVRPSWIRFSDFNGQPPTIVEFGEQELRGA